MEPSQFEKDYYQILNISRDSTQSEVCRAYKTLALVHHPSADRWTRQFINREFVLSSEELEIDEKESLENFETFCNLGEAYDVISDEMWRAAYDKFNEKGIKEGFKGPDGTFTSYAYHGDPQRTFREFFGMDNPFAQLVSRSKIPFNAFAQTGSGNSIRPKSTTKYIDLHLTLNEIFMGCVKKHMVNRKHLEPKGVVSTNDKLFTIPISPGIETGERITFANAGDNDDPSRAPGDIVFIIRETPHPIFSREGPDLVMDVKADFCDSFLGSFIPLETLDRRKMVIPVTDVLIPGYEKVIEGEGFKTFDQGEEKYGNLIIRFDVTFTKKMNNMSLKREILKSIGCQHDGDEFTSKKLYPIVRDISLEKKGSEASYKSYISNKSNKSNKSEKSSKSNKSEK